MAFVVETGTGSATATSYTTVAFADNYHRDQDNVLWTGTASVKDRALMKATEFIDLTYRGEFYGRVKNDGLSGSTRQALEWPRIGVYDEDTYAPVDPDSVPTLVQKATAELALVALTGSLYPDSTTQRVQRRRERAGRVEIETWVEGSEADLPTIRKVKILLRPLLAIAGSASRIDRV